MKNRNYFLIILSIILISCNNLNNDSSDNNDNITVIKIEYAYVDFQVYEPKPIIYSMLDTVILMTKKDRDSLQNNLVYCIGTYRDTDSILNMSIELRDQRRVYCKEINGLFIYNKSIFKFNNIEKKDEFFLKTRKTIRFKCQKENSLFYDHREDKKDSWHFIIENV